MKKCRVCGGRVKDGRTTLCPRQLCQTAAAAGQPPRDKFGFRIKPPRPGLDTRHSTAYRAFAATVKQRALEGEACHYCGGGFDFTLHHNHREAFTVGHLDDLRDGHPAVCPPDRARPAHRGCNSRAALQKANACAAAQRAMQQGRPPRNYTTLRDYGA